MESQARDALSRRLFQGLQSTAQAIIHWRRVCVWPNYVAPAMPGLARDANAVRDTPCVDAWMR